MNDIQKAGSGALAPSDYATFEVAKQNDGIIGGSDIAQIRSYAAYARAQAQAIHKTIAATSGIEDVAAIKAEATETAQTFAKVGIYADQRIGEILRELPKSNRWESNLPAGKTDTVKEAGFTPKTASQLEQIASNPDVVEAVIAQAEQDGRIVSRAQVLKAIKERDAALAEVAELERQNDALYEQANTPQEPQVIEREVESSSARKRIADLQHERDIYLEDIQKMRKRNEEMRRELEQAKTLIGEKERNNSAQWDIAALTTETNRYLRQYSGNAWAFDQFYRVDEVTQSEFIKAINNLAAFAQNMVALIAERKQIGATNE